MVEELGNLGARTVVVPAGRVRQFSRLAGALRRLADLMRATRPDVIVSWMSKTHIYAGPVAHLLGVPSAWFQHGLPSGKDPLDRLAALPARAVLTPSRTVAGAQRAVWPSRRVDVIHPGVEMDGLAGTGPHAPSGLLNHDTRHPSRRNDAPPRPALG
jgi:hypothetical protein